MDFLEFLSFPFMQRALLAGIFLAVLLASMGVYVTLRNMAFFGDGIAHASLAGIAIAILAGISPLPFALAWAVILALLLFILEHKTRLSTDTMIGIFFTTSMAIGVIVMNMTSGYQPELVSFMFGSILAVSRFDLTIIIICTLIILTWLSLSSRQLTFLSLSEEQAIVSGVPAKLQTAAFYVALSVATVLGVSILGIILVSALLVIPAAISRLYANSFRSHVLLTILLSEFIVISGLAFSFYFDLPSGATIVCVGALIFFLSVVFNRHG